MQEGVYDTDSNVAKTWKKLQNVTVIIMLPHALSAMALFILTVSLANPLILTSSIFNLVFAMGGLMAFMFSLGQNNIWGIISILYWVVEFVFVQLLWIAALSEDDEDLWVPVGVLIAFWVISSIYPVYCIFLIIRSILPGLNPNLIFKQPNKQIITVYQEGESIEFNNIEEGQQLTSEAEIPPEFINSTAKQYQINTSKPQTLTPQLIEMDSRQANTKERNKIVSSGIPISKPKGKYGEGESHSEQEIHSI